MATAKAGFELDVTPDLKIDAKPVCFYCGKFEDLAGRTDVCKSCVDKNGEHLCSRCGELFAVAYGLCDTCIETDCFKAMEDQQTP